MRSPGRRRAPRSNGGTGKTMETASESASAPTTLSRLSFHHLQVFRAVARRLSYSRAAEEFVISQPAVSRHVHALERELGAQLLGQVGNRVYLTDAGRMVLAYADRVAELTGEVERALAELENLERGYLRIGAASTPGLYLLPPVVAEFRRRYPGIDVSLRLANSQQVEEAVQRAELDVGFVGARFLPELQVRPYARDELILVVPPGHEFAQRGEVSAAALAEVDLVVREQGSGTRRTLEVELSRLGVTPRRLLELSGCEAVKRAAMAGLGVAVVSARSVGLELRCGELCQVPISDLKLTRELYVVTRKDSRQSAAALTFLALARKQAAAI